MVWNTEHFCPMVVLAVDVFSTQKEAQCTGKTKMCSWYLPTW